MPENDIAIERKIVDGAKAGCWEKKNLFSPCSSFSKHVLVALTQWADQQDQYKLKNSV